MLPVSAIAIHFGLIHSGATLMETTQKRLARGRLWPKQAAHSRRPYSYPPATGVWRAMRDNCRETRNRPKVGPRQALVFLDLPRVLIAFIRQRLNTVVRRDPARRIH